MFIQLLLPCLLSKLVTAATASPEQLAAQYSLTTSTSMPFPSATMATADSQNLIVSDWSLSKGRIQNGPADLAFVNDSITPSTEPILQVTYPAGSFSHDTGGAQLYSLWNTTDGSSFQSMMVSYEVSFDENFDFVKGGKLPGLRGGVNATGCSGGNEPTGKDCFSTRLMWRPNGAGEVYAYIPTPNNLCDQKSIICNDDFGVSISRGAFTFVPGVWNQITLLVQMNSPLDTANGQVILYFNNQSVITQTGLQFRSSEAVVANGLYFSTFFGGSDDSWATPTTTHTYFRNIQLWGGSGASTLTGSKVTSSAVAQFGSMIWLWAVIPLFMASLA
ncbi:hypothetical protein C8J56DRAFT_965242 [Mycena floridula]|nr:hypothetical protein C8J56DRAFT_965242 [Mycena floridula]